MKKEENWQDVVIKSAEEGLIKDRVSDPKMIHTIFSTVSSKLTPVELANAIVDVKGEQSYLVPVEMYGALSDKDKKKVLDAIVGKKATHEELIDAIVKSGAGSIYAREIFEKLPEEDQKKLEDTILNTKGNNL